MSNFTYKITTKAILILGFCFCLTLAAFSQSPQKYLDNGFYEQAFVEAVHKQNKKVKLKDKHASVIYESYEIIYKKHAESINMSTNNWDHSYKTLIRMISFRSRVKHPRVYDNLKNMLYDQPILNVLARKFNDDNLNDIKLAENFEREGKFDKALELYEAIKVRHDQGLPITTMKDQLSVIDYEVLIESTHQKIGDQYIAEAREMLEVASEKRAQAAIDLIKKASYERPLNIEEEELMTVAKMMLGDSWVAEAAKLLETRTKKNARVAYELINRARMKRSLTAEEEQLLERATSLAMTRVMVKVKGSNGQHDAEAMSGILNKHKGSRWIVYYHAQTASDPMDFEIEIAENKPTVVLGDVRKRVQQNTRTIEYWEDVTDGAGNTTRVKKTRLAVGMVAYLSRTKTARLSWSITIKDLSDGQAAHSENRESKVELTNEFVSLESGDILSLPTEIESEVDLDSQPFPTDQDMLNQVTKLYLSELAALIKSRKDHEKHVNVVLDR